MTTLPAGTRPWERPDHVAIGLVLVSSLLFLLGYSLARYLVLTAGLPPLQITFMRCSLTLAAAAIVATWRHSRLTWRRILKPARAWEQRAAAMAIVASIYLSILAYGLMPVTDAAALGYTTPILLTVLAGLVLRERIPLSRWLAAGIGFAGVLLIVQPGAGSSAMGLAASAGGALAYAAYQVVIRRLRDVATSLDSIIQVALAGVVVLAGFMVWSWHPVGLAAFGLVAAASLVQTVGLFCIAAALRRSEASRLAPWQFTGLLWAVLLDAFIFGAAPALASIGGSVLIVAGGVLAQLGFPKSWRSRPHGSRGRIKAG